MFLTNSFALNPVIATQHQILQRLTHVCYLQIIFDHSCQSLLLTTGRQCQTNISELFGSRLAKFYKLRQKNGTCMIHYNFTGAIRPK